MPKAGLSFFNAFGFGGCLLWEVPAFFLFPRGKL